MASGIVERVSEAVDRQLGDRDGDRRLGGNNLCRECRRGIVPSIPRYRSLVYDITCLISVPDCKYCTLQN